MPTRSQRSTTAPRKRSAGGSNGSQPTSASASRNRSRSAKRTPDKAKLPLVASGAAAAGVAAGSVLGAKLRSRRRPRVLGVPMPRGSEIKSAAQWLGRMQNDVRAVRAQADQSRRQSPIEVVLSALTSRRLPRHDA